MAETNREKDREQILPEEAVKDAVKEEAEVRAEQQEESRKSESEDAPDVQEDAVQDKKNQNKKTDKKGKGIKKKKDKKDEKIEELSDRLMRNMAEFENFRKRSEKEKNAMFEMGAKSVIEKILPVVDNFERGMDALTEEEKESPFVKGIEAVYKQLMTSLEEIGVLPIEAYGQEFNPELHNAVMHDEDENFGENTISQEFQKGYIYKESVVRHSMVKVSN